MFFPLYKKRILTVRPDELVILYVTIPSTPPLPVKLFQRKNFYSVVFLQHSNLNNLSSSGYPYVFCTLLLFCSPSNSFETYKEQRIYDCCLQMSLLNAVLSVTY